MSEPTLDDFLSAHEGQLLASKVPQIFWPTIYEKLQKQTLDAGKYFQVIMEEGEDGTKFSTIALKHLSANDANSIFLVDHTWTFRLSNARGMLEAADNLRENLTSILGLGPKSAAGSVDSDSDGEEASAGDDADVQQQPVTSKKARSPLSSFSSKDAQINRILDEIWRYAQTYIIRVANSETSEDDLPVWYLPDAFGIRIGHSFTPNCRMIPFYHSFERITYSLLFPIADISGSDEVTRNYLDHKLFRENPGWRDCLMNPWTPISLAPTKEPTPLFVNKDDSYFLSGRVVDELPDPTAASSSGHEIELPARVFADDFQLVDRLQDVKTEIVDDMRSADILWLRQHFCSFRQLSEENPRALVNQFPFESSLTVKDLFAAIVHSVHGERPPTWFPLTFNLQMELPQFVGHYFDRQTRGEDNTWIVKPWNLARGLDVHVTRNLNCVIRLAECCPKIVSKYVNNPVLFRRPDSGNWVKFDLRYIVFLRSLRPLDVAVYDRFWTRFAVNEFNFDKLDDTLAHLTVHNYNENVKVLNIDCIDFIKRFVTLYPQLNWADIDKKIRAVIREVFQTASTLEPPRGMAPNAQSRAMYGLDFMLHWTDENETDVEVTFIEANFMPDCRRACDFYPDFADSVFQTLFLNKPAQNVSIL